MENSCQAIYLYIINGKDLVPMAILGSYDKPHTSFSPSSNRQAAEPEHRMVHYSWMNLWRFGLQLT